MTLRAIVEQLASQFRTLERKPQLPLLLESEELKAEISAEQAQALTDLHEQLVAQVEATTGPWRASRLNRERYAERPLLLVTSAHPSLGEHGDHPMLGRLVTPRHFSSIEQTAERYPWAADNDCFNGFDYVQYGLMLDRLKPLAKTCLFVAVPDVVGDARATARRFEGWESATRRRGLPSALVLQDGVEELPRWLNTAWPRINAVFVGGTTEWKLGPTAAAIARAAKRRGKWVHWGRVNSYRRIDYIRSTGACDSFDGTQWAMFRHTYLDEGLRHLLTEQLPLLEFGPE